MGGHIEPINREVNGSVNKDNGAGAGAGAGRSGNSTNSTNARSTDGAGAGAGSGAGAGAGNQTKEEILPKLVVVDDAEKTDEQKRQERNARRRERYAQQKAESGQTVKPRKVNKGKKEQTPPIDTAQINALIMSLSVIVASRPNCEQWLLTESEIDSITKPLVAMLSESQALEVVTKNSNQIALAFACVSVFAPRVMITVQKQKQEKEKVKHAKVGTTKTSNQKLDRPNDERTSNDDKKPSDSQPFYGLPIS